MAKTNITSLRRETYAERLPVRDMVVDPTYQGHVNRPLVQKIAANWNDAAAGAVILNMREDNSYAVLDGQHRVLAAKKAGVKELNALVFVGKTHEEEATLFVQLNTKHNVRPIDRFRAALTAGSPREQEIAATVARCGLEIKDGPAPNAVRSVVALLDIYDNFGVGHLQTSISTLKSAWDSYSDPLAWSDMAVRGMSAFIYRYPMADLERLAAKLSGYAPNIVRGMAVAKAVHGESGWILWGKVFTGIYNAGFKTNNKGYLNEALWDKNIYTPKGKRSQDKGRSIDHLKRFQFKKGGRNIGHDVRMAAKAGKK